MVAAGALCLAGCIRDSGIICGELECPVGSVCAATGCASPAQLAACANVAEGEACATTGFEGACASGVCVPVICGDGDVIGPEVCDDANGRSGDGCSADCRSLEVCGNGIADPLLGEQCDVGLAGLSGDGCTSRCTVELTTWSEVPTTASGPWVGDSAAAYMPWNGKTLVFGGMGSTTFNNSWEWDGAWRLLSANGPGARSGHAMAATKDRVILHGGRSPTSVSLSDTWAWDGAAWAVLTPLHPLPARYNHSMTYDTKRDRIVAFGGRTSSGSGNTWEWDGADWIELTPSHSPPATTAAAAYDPVRGKTVVYSGSMWEWDGTDWIEAAPASAGPTPRSNEKTAYDAARGTIILFGGEDAGGAPADTWEWNGTMWRRLDEIVAPPGRFGHALIYDPIRGQVMMFGGWNPGFVRFRDTWVHRFRSQAVPPEACAGVDNDGDGLVNCADPDCWGRCAPFCPPNAACDPAAAHCGDTTCSSIEDHLLCPSDCALPP